MKQTEDYGFTIRTLNETSYTHRYYHTDANLDTRGAQRCDCYLLLHLRQIHGFY